MITQKDVLIIREVALKAAVDSIGPIKSLDTPEFHRCRILDLAVDFEKHIMREQCLPKV